MSVGVWIFNSLSWAEWSSFSRANVFCISVFGKFWCVISNFFLCPRDTKLWDHDVVVWKLLAGFVLFSLVCVHNGEHCSNFF